MKKRINNQVIAVVVAVALAIIFTFGLTLPSASAKDSNKDIQVLMKLQEEFVIEMAGMRGRLDAMDMRLSNLEASQKQTRETQKAW
jgi:TolA-binding protein